MEVTDQFHSGLRGFLAFCEAIDVDLADFQKRIARAVFGVEREVAVVLPRGNAKTTTAALLALHHLVTEPHASVSLGAASREQAAIAYTVMREHAEHPALREHVEARHLALRTERGGVLRVVSGRGDRAHGQTDSLMLGDEVWNWPDDKLLAAFQTGLVKRPDAKLILISTAASSMDSPLGRLRARALAGTVTRHGARIDATAPGLRWAEWSLADDKSLDDWKAIAACNPAPWITTAALREQAERVTPAAFAQFHACRWGAGEGAWLPPGAWTACQADYTVEDGTPVVIGVDIGGSRAASAVVAVTDDLRVAAVEVIEGNASVLEATAAILAMADRFTVREVTYDPWRFASEALRLEAEHGVTVVEFPQSHSRMTVASEGLHAAIVEGRLRHPGDPDLDRHVAAAIAKPTGRGWRLDKAEHRAQIDAAIALCMAVERAEHRPEPARLLGWI